MGAEIWKSYSIVETENLKVDAFASSGFVDCRYFVYLELETRCQILVKHADKNGTEAWTLVCFVVVESLVWRNEQENEFAFTVIPYHLSFDLRR